MKILLRFACAFLFASLFFFAGANAEETPAAPAPAKVLSPAELVKQGRAFFTQTKYPEALRAFEKALDQDPGNKETRFLAATAAYWARKPERALDYWNRLGDTARRGSNDEWEIQKNRVMTLAALGQVDAAETAVERLREIRAGGKSSAARAAKGFVRENFFGKNMRAGCWESFDERGDAPAIWTVTVTRLADPANRTKDQPAEKTLATLAVETAALPGGGIGFVFSEETDDARRIYKRWTARPEYADVRALIVGALDGTAQPIEEKALKPILAAVVPDDEESDEPLEIRRMGLDPQAETIVFTAWKLKPVLADVTRLARIPPGDAAAIEDYMTEFNSKYPHAAATGSKLTELMSTAQPAAVRAACEKLAKLQARSAYLEFAVLTALNTRNRDISEDVVLACAKSKDFLVRQTAALLMARHGRKTGLEMLFNEIENADPRGCELLMGAVEELIGHAIDSPPNAQSPTAEEKLKDWKASAAEWRTANLDKLEFNRDAKAGEPIWAKK